MVSHLTSAPASSSITDMGLASCSRACCGDHHITRLKVFDLRIYVLFPLLVMEMVWFCKITFCPSAWDISISLWPLKVFREFKSHEPHLVGLITSGFLCVGSVCLFTYFISFFKKSMVWTVSPGNLYTALILLSLPHPVCMGRRWACSWVYS